MSKIQEYIVAACGYDERGLPASLTQFTFGTMPFSMAETEKLEDVMTVTKAFQTDAIVEIDIVDNILTATFDFSMDTPILRKGAISAKDGEPVIIPINMRDGMILGTGLGNQEWNYSAPHGAGRIMKREDIKSHYTVSAFKNSMKGIYSSCINKDTLDEAPFAYRDIETIKDAIQDTVAIKNVIKPIYNFKAGKK